MTQLSSLDIDPDELAIVEAILAKHVPDATVWAFGSRATGKAKKFSDLDLCIKANQLLGIELMSVMAEDFAESNLPWKVDLVDWWSASERFRAIIDRDKVMIRQALC